MILSFSIFLTGVVSGFVLCFIILIFILKNLADLKISQNERRKSNSNGSDNLKQSTKELNKQNVWNYFTISVNFVRPWKAG
jgi:hypothetical protein